MREVYLREKESGLGLEAAKMTFLQKNGLLYVNSRCSEGSLAAVSRAHEAVRVNFTATSSL